MGFNKTGGYSGKSVQTSQRSVQKALTGTNQIGQDGVSGTRTLSGQTNTQTSAQPPKTTGSAPTFQNSGSGTNTGGNKPSK